MWHQCGPIHKIRVATIQLKTTQPFTNTAQTELPTSIMASLTLRESSSPTMSEQESSCCWALVNQSTQALWRCRKFSWSSMFFSECSTCSCHTRVHSCFLLLCFHTCTGHSTALSTFFNRAPDIQQLSSPFFLLPPIICSCLNKYTECTTATRIYAKCHYIQHWVHCYQPTWVYVPVSQNTMSKDSKLQQIHKLQPSEVWFFGEKQNKHQPNMTIGATWSTRPA